MDGNCIFLLVSVYVMENRYERVQRKMHYNYRGLVFGAFRRMPDGLIYVWAERVLSPCRNIIRSFFYYKFDYSSFLMACFINKSSSKIT